MTNNKTYRIEIRVDGQWTSLAPVLQDQPVYHSYEEAQRDAYHLPETCDGSYDGVRVVDSDGADYGWTKCSAVEE